MFFSYETAILLSVLALYGVWCFGEDCWHWRSKTAQEHAVPASLVLVVREVDEELNALLQCILTVMRRKEGKVELVIVSTSRASDGAREPWMPALWLTRSGWTPEAAAAAGVACCRFPAVYVLNSAAGMDTAAIRIIAGAVLQCRLL